MPATGDEPAEGRVLGRLWIGVHRLWIKPLGEGDHLIGLDGDCAEAVHVAFNIVLEVTIGD